MEETRNGKEGLIRGIERDVRGEAGKILEQAEKSISERRKATRAQVEGILAAAEKKAEEQVQAIRRGSASGVAVETRRISLKVREQIIKETIAQVSRQMASMIELPEYSGVLKDWIIEAAIGLNAPEAEVIASKREMPLVNRNLLKEAMEEIKRLTGRSVKLKVSEEDPLLVQGIALKAKGGHLAFSNQVQTRFLRYDSEIRRIVYRRFFEE